MLQLLTAPQHVDLFVFRSYLCKSGAIGYVTPKNMLAGHRQEIHRERDGKWKAAREQRKNRRQQAA